MSVMMRTKECNLNKRGNMPEEKEVTIAEIIFHNDNNAYTVAGRSE